MQDKEKTIEKDDDYHHQKKKKKNAGIFLLICHLINNILLKYINISSTAQHIT